MYINTGTTSDTKKINQATTEFYHRVKKHYQERRRVVKARGRQSKQVLEPMKVLPKERENPEKLLPMASELALMSKRGIYCPRSRVKSMKPTRSCRTVGLAMETRFLPQSLLS